MSKEFYVYILASERNGTLYVGVTNDLIRRIQEHRQGVYQASFTHKYSVNKLIHYEVYHNPIVAIEREKLLKKWKRKWKLELVEESNPNWEDLSSVL